MVFGLKPNRVRATVAQLVEQGIRNAQVCGSTPHGGSMFAVRASLFVHREPFLLSQPESFGSDLYRESIKSPKLGV